MIYRDYTILEKNGAYKIYVPSPTSGELVKITNQHFDSCFAAKCFIDSMFSIEPVKKKINSIDIIIEALICSALIIIGLVSVFLWAST